MFCTESELCRMQIYLSLSLVFAGILSKNDTPTWWTLFACLLHITALYSDNNFLYICSRLLTNCTRPDILIDIFNCIFGLVMCIVHAIPVFYIYFPPLECRMKKIMSNCVCVAPYLYQLIPITDNPPQYNFILFLNNSTLRFTQHFKYVSLWTVRLHQRPILNMISSVI